MLAEPIKRDSVKPARLWRSMRPGGDPARLFRKQAKAAQREGRFRDAAALYVEALHVEPLNGPDHVQAGHMFKEAGEFRSAHDHYMRAAGLMPDNADLALQLGHFHKTVGQLGEAREAYVRAAELAPNWEEPAKEIKNIDAAGFRGAGEREGAPAFQPLFAENPDRRPFDPEVALSYGRLAPERLPRPFQELIHRSEPSLNISQFGVDFNTFWGMRRVARGVEAIRGFCISTELLLEVTALVNGLPVHRGPVKGPYELEYEPDQERIHKYVFNIWYDFSRFAPGLYVLELRFRDENGKSRSIHEEFVIEAPLREEDHPNSDAVVNLVPGDTRSIDEQINERPSAIHEAERPNMLPKITSILVMRPDQLGDMVVSVPGILRLRELFPHARIVGLVSPANADLARSLHVFDELISINYRESMPLRTRVLSWDEQEAMREQLAAYSFDIAIDLSRSSMSRPLLALSGAPFLYGFEEADWPRLSASSADTYLDPKNRREIATHSTRVLTMIDRLAALMNTSARVIRREELSRDRLRAFGIMEQDRYAVLHTGARIIFSRWAHYAGLAERLHHDTDLKIILFTDKTNLRDDLPADIAASERIVIIDRQLPFDDFDALLSFCSVYVGNDSGPKHLASLRGVPVVSIHSARINWSEWGQELTGAIVTRKLPCAGCLIYHDVDDCGKDFVCMTAISLDDVYAVVRRYV
jgi:ADP-heptose:LPS heptosyltransferase